MAPALRSLLLTTIAAVVPVRGAATYRALGHWLSRGFDQAIGLGTGRCAFKSRLPANTGNASAIARSVCGFNAQDAAAGRSSRRFPPPAYTR